MPKFIFSIILICTVFTINSTFNDFKLPEIGQKVIIDTLEIVKDSVL